MFFVVVGCIVIITIIHDFGNEYLCKIGCALACIM